MQIRQADSLGVLDEAVRWRMALAALSKPKEAQALYEEVVHLADSTGRIEDELTARKALANTLAARGQMNQAYDEALRVADKSAEWSAQQAEVSKEKADEFVRLAAQQRDSLATASDAGRREAELRINEAHEDTEFWMVVAIGAIAVGLIALVVVVAMNGRAVRKQRAEIGALRAELDALRERPKNRMRETVVVPAEQPQVPPPVVAPVERGPASAPLDPMLEAMFRKQAPERLIALHDARSRGDHEKVQRVVHTLKPQLVNFDPSFAERCSRITEVGAPKDQPRWNAELDAFEQAVKRLLP